MFERQFPRETGPQGIMVVFIQKNIQSEMNTTTMIPCGLVSWRELPIA